MGCHYSSLARAVDEHRQGRVFSPSNTAGEGEAAGSHFFRLPMCSSFRWPVSVQLHPRSRFGMVRLVGLRVEPVEKHLPKPYQRESG
uniref:Uncharacterized protein n=1 Tax=Setaria viridis TaxID=4556 RepID=A0A4U6V6Q9_SETVI|nr:hypothetical protein SEVIR_3G077350v2 [Setaria viridis]